MRKITTSWRTSGSTENSQQRSIKFENKWLSLCNSDPLISIYLKKIWYCKKFVKSLLYLVFSPPTISLSNCLLNFSFVFIRFAARRKTIMEDFSPAQKCLLFLVFLKISGRDNAWPNAKWLYPPWFYNDSASDTITSYDIPSNNAKY